MRAVMVVGMVLLLPGLVLAGNRTGRVVDAQTGAPLVGADVYLQHSRVGTTTDSLGWFQLTITREQWRDTLVVHFLGYRELRLPVVALENQALLRLQPVALKAGEGIEVWGEKQELVRQDIPHARSTIHFEEITAYGSQEISDVLKTVPSVRITGNDLDGRRMEIRGSNADEVNVYLDGILINNLRLDNAADLSLISPEDIGRLEVLKGGNYSLLGSGAFGGVVNVVTRRSMERRFRLKAKMGNLHTRILLGEINLPVSQRMVVNYFGQYHRLSPEVEYFPLEQFSDKTENKQITTERQNHHLSLSFFPQNGQWTARLLSYSYTYRKPGWEDRNNNLVGALSFRGNLPGIRDVEMMINQFTVRDRVDRVTEGTTHYLSDYRVKRVNARLAKKFTGSSWEVQTLTEYFHEELSQNSRSRSEDREVPLYRADVYDNRIAGAAVFSATDQLSSRPGLSWKTYLGIRLDALASGQQDLTHTVGVRLTYRQKEWEYAPYFNFGKNVKYPSLLEAAYVRELVDFSRRDSLARRLEPEYNNSTDIGVRVKQIPEQGVYREMEMSLSVFTRTVYNKLLKQPYGNELANFQLGRNVTRGLEAALSWKELYEYFTVQLAYLKLNVSEPLLYAYKPEESFSAQLRFRSSAGWYGTATVFYEGNSVAWYYDLENHLRTKTLSPFYDMDVVVGWRFPLIGITVHIQLAGYNLLDHAGYRYDYLKKRYVQISLGVRY